MFSSAFVEVFTKKKECDRVQTLPFLCLSFKEKICKSTPMKILWQSRKIRSRNFLQYPNLSGVRPTKVLLFSTKKTKANKVVNYPIVSFLNNFEYLNNLRSCCSWVVLIYLRRIFSEGSNFSDHSGELCFSKCFILEHDTRGKKYDKKVKQKRTMGFSRLFCQS